MSRQRIMWRKKSAAIREMVPKVRSFIVKDWIITDCAKISASRGRNIWVIMQKSQILMMMNATKMSASMR